MANATFIEPTASVHAPDLGGVGPAAIGGDRSEPCTIVIFGASGDLTARKLIPALYRLHENGGLHERYRIVGCSRTPLTDDAFRDRMRQALLAARGELPRDWEEFARRLHYRPLTYDSSEAYAGLADALHDLDEKHQTARNRVFYCSVPPSLYPVIAERIGGAGLSREQTEQNGWARFVVEKPFGVDLETAQALNGTLHAHFEEHQIFRIDHYLAKETVQNLLVLRFANTIFEPLWHRHYVDHVGIIAAEQLGIGGRAGYYEQSGVLRDMFQNHMMQLLALTAMEPPPRFESRGAQDEKVKVFRSLSSLQGTAARENMVLGQYTAGTVQGKPVPGYREEENVATDSSTPTFAAMRLFVENWRWRGVPFYLMSGKRLGSKITRIVVQFRRVPHSIFRHSLGLPVAANRLVLGIYPQERITLTFQTKNPGAEVRMRPVTMDFDYAHNYQGPMLDAYAKALLDTIHGDHMLFWRQDGVEECWRFLDPVLAECQHCNLHTYPAGSWGPAAAKKWVEAVVDET